MARVLTRYRPLIEEISRDLPLDAAILDLGSGPTCPGRLFPRKDRTFLDPLMDTYREVYKDELPEGELLAAQAERIPKPDATFHVVLSVNALDHMVDPETVLAEVARVLRPDGRFLLGLFLHPPALAAARRFVERVLPFLREDAHPYSFTRASARALLAPRFTIERETVVFRRESAMFPSLHREDRLFVCRKR